MKTKIAVILSILILIVGIFIGRTMCKEEPITIDPTHETILQNNFAKMGYENLNSVDIIDHSVDNNNWVLYYCYADGDCYVVEMHHNAIVKCEIMN